MKHFFFILLLAPLFLKSQSNSSKPNETDTRKSEIQKNILRVLLSASTDTKFSFTANYEREIIKPLTLFLKTGPAFDREYTNTDVSGNEQYKWLFNFLLSAELRCYYNLNRRMKLQKNVRNFSAFYFSLEEQLVSKPIIMINKSENEVSKGKNSAYINIGYQRQKYHTYYQIYLGTRFPGKIYSTIPAGIDLLHGGVTIGRVF